MPSDQSAGALPRSVSTTLALTTIVAVVALPAARILGSQAAGIIGIAAATCSACLWGYALGRTGREFKRRAQSAVTPDDSVGRTLRRGLPTPSYTMLLALSALAAVTVFAASRSAGISALAWGVATICLGSAIGALRLYGYRQRFDVRSPGPASVSAADTDAKNDATRAEDWLRVSRNATAAAMVRLQKAQLVSLILAATITQIVVGERTWSTAVAIATVVGCTILNLATSSPTTRRITSVTIAVTSFALLTFSLGSATTAGAFSTGVVLAWTCVMCTASAFAVPAESARGSSIAIASAAGLALVALWHWRFFGQGSEFEGALTGFNWILIPAAALCFAHVTATLSATLQSLSQTFDAVSWTAWQRLNEATTQSARDAAIFEASRLVHDTLINSLGAVRSQRIEADRLRQRLTDDLALLDADGSPQTQSQSDESASLESVLNRALARASVLGVHVHDENVADTGTVALAAVQADAVFGSIVEALTNVSKHTSDKVAEVSFRRGGPGTPSLRITSSISRGQAIDPSRDGMSKSIIERCARADLKASITIDDQYLNVEIEFPATRVVRASSSDRVNDPAQPAGAFDVSAYLENATLAATRSVTFWPIGYCILLSAAWVSFFGWGWWLVGAVLATAAALTAINVRAGDLAAAWLLPTTVATVALVLVWQFNGPIWSADLGALGPLGLSYIGAAVVVVSFLFTDASRWAAVAVVAGYVGGCAIAVLLFLHAGSSAWLPVVAAILMAGFAIPLALTSQWLRDGARHAAERARHMSERETLQRRTDSNRRARERIISLAVGQYRDFIEGIARGHFQIDDPSVLSEVSRVERALRAYVHVGSVPGPATDDTLALIARAQDAGIIVDVVAFDSSQNDNLVDLSPLTSVGSALISGGSPGDVLAISTYREQGLFGLTLVMDRLVARPTQLGVAGHSSITWVATPDQTFVDFQLENHLTR